MNRTATWDQAHWFISSRWATLNINPEWIRFSACCLLALRKNSLRHYRKF